MQPAPNQVLAGKYRLSKQLGQGGMGSVWLAEHLTLRSPVAIKLIETSIAANPEALARFLREAQAAASLRSPHVVQILDHGVDGGVPFIVMEVLEGESLAARLARVGRLSSPETAKIITHVGRAMRRAHEAGVVHRDLKPDNIYIVHNDEEELAKVLDFGVAKSSTHGLGAAATSGTQTGAMLGTPYYMSPEQVEGTKTLDHRTDIWAMGVIAWECLLGSQPFEAETLGGLLLAICAREMPVPSRHGLAPPGFDAWFARACSRDLAGRFSTAKEAAAELRRICGDVLPRAEAPRPPATEPWVPTGTPAVSGYTASGYTAGSYAPAKLLTPSPLARTTGDLGVNPPPRQGNKHAGLFIAIAALLVLALAGVAGAVLVLRGRSTSGGSMAAAEPASSATSPAPVAPASTAPANFPETVAAAPPTPLPPAPSAGQLASASALHDPAHVVTPASPARAPAPPAKRAPAAVAPHPAAPVPTNVNLGI